MNTQNKSVHAAPAYQNLDTLCIQRLNAPDFAQPQKLSTQILKFLRSKKRG
ncbi:hypothetical protein [Acinetobacter guillouiae]|uniref:hypothetical protein n=1 Tax=Acinetobacter guillouiae TaxID=106649 RepID=UPI001AE14D4A|nr:hypothetical protein [Acinetobacter guillouiae]MBP2544672.1 hypothetical protein [Acinetobacter guillouiae]